MLILQRTSKTNHARVRSGDEEDLGLRSPKRTRRQVEETFADVVMGASGVDEGSESDPTKF
jgi:hypothetical protein